jgi:uncharacterized protein (TIGR02646 family)
VSFRFNKSKEPTELRAWIRENEPVAERSFDDLRETKNTVRTRLHRDQRGLCCYCYTRVNDDYISHVEHVVPQDRDNRFDWDNLALACHGGNQGKNPPHCDHSKGEAMLDTVVHPYKAPVSRFVTLRDKGRLGVDETARRDVEQVLKLNARHLQRQRESVRQAVIAMLQRRKRPDEGWRQRDMEQTLNELRSRREPLDYQPLIEDWLERRLRRDS